MTLRPDLTVAAIVESDGQFLLVEERVAGALVFNQPAGHVEKGENFIDAVVRETLEETAWTFHPEALVGIYFWEQPGQPRSFLRAAFCGRVSSHDPSRPLDRGIERAVWLTREQIVARSTRLRSPMVLGCIGDYLDGARYPLDVIKHVLKDPSKLSAADLRARAIDHPAISRVL
jgi:8-oxo-dGTP pyrophosphatase MutT (NUDIX family)